MRKITFKAALLNIPYFVNAQVGIGKIIENDSKNSTNKILHVWKKITLNATLLGFAYFTIDQIGIGISVSRTSN